jgi:DNA-binding MarR family transcriptional regulator
MKTASAIPLLENWEKFSQENPQKDMYDFAQWLLALRKEHQKDVPKPSRKNEDHAARVAVLITRLQKYLTLKVKPTVKQLGFTREHEYNFLYQVSKMNKPNKNNLSKENMVEFSTGRDIIRRLIQKNLITEKADPDDKRAMLLVLTAKGRKLLEKSFEGMAGSFTDFLGDLSVREQVQLISLLTKLTHFQAIKNNRELLSYL